MMHSYRHCADTITVYNCYGEGEDKQYHRTVIHGASLQFHKQWKDTKTGASETSPFLLVIPQGADGKLWVPSNAFVALQDKQGFYTLADGDKVLLGEGPAITDYKAWGAFVPAAVDGLVVIKSASPERHGGEVVHIEAGG